MIEGFPTLPGGLDGDFKPVFDLGLATKLGEEGRPQRDFEGEVRFDQGAGDEPFRHGVPRMEKAATSDKGVL